MNYKIILIDFAYSDESGSKLRPALTLTKPSNKYGDLIVAAITSNTKRKHQSGDVKIERGDIDFAKTGLKESSVIRLGKLVTTHVSKVKNELGVLPKKYHFDIQ
ncbi:growth inhibitor PemK, partial [Candidatus Falkowbacteria bacterium CG10_big_fil_rev_8_21_14_0_10_39_11]